MPLFCCVVQWGSRGGRDDVKFFRIPAIRKFQHKQHLNNLSVKRRCLWINAIKRGDLTETKLKYACVCSSHFISGKFKILCIV